MKTTADLEAARELELYAENTREIYDRCTMPTVDNLTRKYKRGQYDKAKAVKAWEARQASHSTAGPDRASGPDAHYPLHPMPAGEGDTHGDQGQF